MRITILIMLLLITGCDDKKSTATSVQKDSAANTQRLPDTMKTEEDSALVAWTAYYRTENPDFSFEKFTETSTSPITYTETSGPTLLDGTLGPEYKPFLIHDPDKSKYIDFDSYLWFIAPDGKASFDVDQKIVLVDLQKETVQQIGFFGPSYTVEEGFWKNKNEAVLLGNTYEKVPFYIEYDFTEGKQTWYQYPDTLRFNKPYLNARLGKFGIGTD